MKKSCASTIIAWFIFVSTGAAQTPIPGPPVQPQVQTPPPSTGDLVAQGLLSDEDARMIENERRIWGDTAAQRALEVLIEWEKMSPKERDREKRIQSRSRADLPLEDLEWLQSKEIEAARRFAEEEKKRKQEEIERTLEAMRKTREEYERKRKETPEQRAARKKQEDEDAAVEKKTAEERRKAIEQKGREGVERRKNLPLEQAIDDAIEHWYEEHDWTAGLEFSPEIEFPQPSAWHLVVFGR